MSLNKAMSAGRTGNGTLFKRHDKQARQTSTCWLCGRVLGQRVEWHHPKPKSRGGRDVVAVHPICHRTIHACFSNVDLARIGSNSALLAAHPAMQKFIAWIANKPPDFHAPTHTRKE